MKRPPYYRSIADVTGVPEIEARRTEIVWDAESRYRALPVANVRRIRTMADRIREAEARAASLPLLMARAAKGEPLFERSA